MGSETSPDNIFVNIQTKRHVNLLCDSGATESQVAPLHLDNRVDKLPLGSFGTWRSFAGPAVNKQLMLQKQIFSDNGPGASKGPKAWQ